MEVHEEMVSLEEKRIAILNRIKFHPKIVDLKLCCYMAACNAISKEVPLLPSPKDYIQKQPLKDALEEINETIPNMQLLRFYLEKPDVFRLSGDTMSLLYWLLVRLQDPGLIVVKDLDDPVFNIDIGNPRNEGSGDDGIRGKADMILRFCYLNNASWKAKSQKKKTRLGFTPVRLQDLHSAIHRGPRGLEDKGCLGFGLTLCSELGYAIERAESSWVWGKSTLASEMRAVLVIEFVDTEKAVLKLARRSPVYFLISDTNYARIRYLLVWYSAPPAKLPVLPKSPNATVKVTQPPNAIFGMLLMVTCLLLRKQSPSFLQRGIQKTLSLLKDRLFQHGY